MEKLGAKNKQKPPKPVKHKSVKRPKPPKPIKEKPVKQPSKQQVPLTLDSNICKLPKPERKDHSLWWEQRIAERVWGEGTSSAGECSSTSTHQLQSADFNASVLRTRFHIVYSREGKPIVEMTPTIYTMLLFKLAPFKPQSHHNRPVVMAYTYSKGDRRRREMKSTLGDKKLDPAHMMFSYDCPDCWFVVRGLPFVPTVYLVIDHFLDCKDHLVTDHVRQMFLMERESFNAFLGPKFNHLCILPKTAVLTTNRWKPLNVFHTSLRLPGVNKFQARDEWQLKTEEEEEEDDWDEEEEEAEDEMLDDAGEKLGAESEDDNREQQLLVDQFAGQLSMPASPMYH